MTFPNEEIKHPHFFQLASVQKQLQWKLVQQLEKDLEISINSIDPALIFEEVKTRLNQAANSGQLAHLLYRVDLEESRMPNSADESFLEKLSLAVIRREAQKVLFRHQYENG